MLSTKSYFLTTHSGSLPRTKDLVELYVALSRGEEVDKSKLEDAIYTSTDAVIQNQINSGIHIGNNGEQTRESFFSYVRHRMSGFGGASNRPAFQDMVDYPSWVDLKLSGYLDGVSLISAPQAQGEVTYTNKDPLEKEIDQFKDFLAKEDSPFEETFMTAPSPGIIAAAMEDMFYGDMDAYLEALAAAL